MNKFLIIITGLLLSVTGFGQIKMPAASPFFEVKGTVGFAEVKVEYSRPSARGRQVAGNLIPYNEVWRTGANAPTKITFSEEVKVNGNMVPAGTYALCTQFTPETATVILSKNLELWGSIGYDSSQDQLRFDVPVKHPSSHYETFTISFSDFTRNSANLNLKWEKTKIMFTIESEVDAKVMAQIEEQLVNNTPANPGVYYQGASYYYDTERDSEQALAWVNKAIEATENPQYWVVHLKAKLLARMGKNKEAIAAAKQSMDLAKAGNNPDYVRLNEKLISSMK